MRDDAVGEHARKHHVAALLAGLRVEIGVVHRGGVGNADERGGLRDGQVGCVHAVVVLRGGLNAVASVAVIDGVQVHQQDFFLGVLLLHLDGKLDLAHLALEGDLGRLVGKQGVAHQLLRDGGCALLAAREVHEHRADDALQVGTVVLIEAHVLGGDGAVDHIGAYLVQAGERLALLEIELGEHRAFARLLVVVGGIDGRLFGHRERVGVVNAGQIFAPFVNERHSALIAAEYGQAKAQQYDEYCPLSCVCARLALFSPCFHGWHDT